MDVSAAELRRGANGDVYVSWPSDTPLAQMDADYQNITDYIQTHILGELSLTLLLGTSQRGQQKEQQQHMPHLTNPRNSLEYRKGTITKAREVLVERVKAMYPLYDVEVSYDITRGLTNSFLMTGLRLVIKHPVKGWTTTISGVKEMIFMDEEELEKYIKPIVEEEEKKATVSQSNDFFTYFTTRMSRMGYKWQIGVSQKPINLSTKPCLFIKPSDIGTPVEIGYVSDLLLLSDDDLKKKIGAECDAVRRGEKGTTSSVSWTFGGR